MSFRAMYKRDEDGIVLVDQDACRVALLYDRLSLQKVYFNWKTNKVENVHSASQELKQECQLYVQKHVQEE